MSQICKNESGIFLSHHLSALLSATSDYNFYRSYLRLQLLTQLLQRETFNAICDHSHPELSIFKRISQKVMDTTQPNYSKRIFTLLVILIILAVIYFANNILFPLLLAFILSILIRPIDSFLQAKLRFPKLLSVLVTLLVALIGFAAILFLIGIQMKDFVSDFPKIEKHFSDLIKDLNNWVYQEFGVTYLQQKKYVKESLMKADMVSMESVGSFTNALTYTILIPIYMFLFLFYRSLLLTFLMKFVPNNDEGKLQIVVNDIKSIIRKYITGLLIEVVVVATLTSVGFWIVGVKYALFLGLITAVFNLVPYVGIVVAAGLSCIVALSGSATMESVIGVLIVTAIVQFLDNNILMPRIVGSKVRINALASILSVIVGGTLAGVPGMFLAIPVAAMLKVIFDAIPQFEPYGYLLGDEIPNRVFWTKRTTINKK